MTLDGCPTVRFSTAELPEKDRITIWRDYYCRMLMKLDIEPINDVPLECAILTRTLPGVHMMSTAMSPTRITRTREFLSENNGDFIFVINQTGSVNVRARNREILLREGDALLMSTSEVKVFDRPVHGGSLSFRMSRSTLSPIVPNVDDLVMQLIPQRIEALKLLAGYAAPLFNDIALTSPEFRRTAVNHLHDLIALSLGSAHDSPGGSRLPAARLEMAKAFIVENSHQRDLSVGGVAAQFGLTPRNLQRLFENEGTTFSEFLLARRLNHAHRMLTEPRLALSAVATIAYDAGFGDLSYFNRSFKRHFGATPRDVRRSLVKSAVSTRHTPTSDI